MSWQKNSTFFHFHPLLNSPLGVKCKRFPKKNNFSSLFPILLNDMETFKWVNSKIIFAAQTLGF